MYTVSLQLYAARQQRSIVFDRRWSQRNSSALLRLSLSYTSLDNSRAKPLAVLQKLIPHMLVVQVHARLEEMC
jgi:hypothetical protein